MRVVEFSLDLTSKETNLYVSSKRMLSTKNTRPTLHGYERFPGYVPSFIVLTKFAQEEGRS